MATFDNIVDGIKARSEICVKDLDKKGCDFKGLLNAVDTAIGLIESSDKADRSRYYESLLDLFIKERILFPSEKIPLPNIAARIETYRDKLFAKPPVKKEWKGHVVETHLVPFGDEMKEATLLRVEKQFDLINHPYLLSAQYYRADASTSTDPIGDYNCFALAFHTKDIPINDGCVDRTKLRYCSHGARLWPGSNIKTGVAFGLLTPFYPRSLDKSCHDPAGHVLKDGYRFVNVLTEEIKPGDRIIYFVPATESFIAETRNKPAQSSPDPELSFGTWWQQIHIPQFPTLGIQHAAIVTHVTENDILVLEKMDHGEAVVSSAFDNDIQFGDLFAVIRKENSLAAHSPQLTKGKCMPSNETLEAAEKGNPWAKWYQHILYMAETREKNCAKNPKCPDF